MGTITRLRAPVVRRAEGHFRGRSYTVALLPGDLLELRSSFGRRAYRAPLASVFAGLVAHSATTIADCDAEAEAQRTTPGLQALCDELGLAIITAALAHGVASRRVFALGIPGDGAEDCLGVPVTPWFEDHAALVEFCTASYEKIIDRGAP